MNDINNTFLTAVKPTAVKSPELVGWSNQLASELNIEKPLKQSAVTDVLSGNNIIESMKPYAHCYGGHQFGHWAGRLGDGRAITLAEINIYDLQLKGSGITPYSRQGDGRAVLRSSLREFVCSEAMFNLKIPTTRSLSLVLTGDSVLRDILYDGHPAYEPGAITSRLSPSFIRFGNFEFLAFQKKQTELKKLADDVIENFYPEILNNNIQISDEKKYAEFLKQVSIRTAEMISGWMAVGFVHGVMNTDNMSILGLTIDYGPYGWIEEFDPQFTPNTTDFSNRRYQFSQQPEMALWNLNCLANALYSLILDKDLVTESLMAFQVHYEIAYLEKLSNKLGLQTAQIRNDQNFLSELFDLLYVTKIDYTLFFRSISDTNFENHFLEIIKKVSYLNEISIDLQDRWSLWLSSYVYKISEINQDQEQDNQQRINIMKKNNPSIIFRNYLAQLATDQITKENKTDLLEKYIKEFENPFQDRNLEQDSLTFKRPGWADNKPGCSILSCSS